MQLNWTTYRWACIPCTFLLAVLVGVGCGTTRPDGAAKPEMVGDVAEEGAGARVGERRQAKIKIATFNIQILGKSKAGKPEIMSQLGAIIRKYDVVAVQEIRDSKNEVPGLFLEEINKDGANYDMVVSPRTGQQDANKSSQEQYVYYFNTETITKLDDGVLFDDSEKDRFQREPWLAKFGAKGGSFTFVLLSIHTRPEAAVEEIGALAYVFAWAQKHYQGEDDLIALGDFNAGCSYAKPAELDVLVLGGPSFSWLVPHTADTNLATKQCAYDRFVTTKGTDEDYAGQWDVDRAFTDKKVSDHWPVWAEFFVGKDTQGDIGEVPVPGEQALVCSSRC